MIDKFKEVIEKFKKTWWIGAIIYIVIAIFILPPLIFARFNIKTKILSNYNILDFPTLFSEGTNNSFSKLNEIAQYNTSKIPEEEKWPGLVEINGIKYIANHYINTLIILIAIYLWILFKTPESKNEYEDIEHGSSDWADKKEIYSKFTDKDGIILAENIKLNMDTKVKGNKNVLVVGSAGSGKSAGFVRPNVTQNLGSYVFTDPKGELFDYSAKYFEAQGYDVKVLNLKNPKNSDGYNPILNIENDIDLDVVANTIVKGQQEPGAKDDPYFTDNAQLLLKALIRFLMEIRPVEEQNLTSCANLVRSSASDSSGNMLLKLMQILPEDHLARKDFESVALATDKGFSSIASTLQSLLSKFETPDIAALTSTNTINFEDIGRKKTALYVISSDTNSTFDFLLTIFFSQMLDKLYEEADNHGGALKIPVVFFLDEFANIGRIPDFDRKIATSRSRRLSFNVILQSLEQLENIYGNTYETIVGNCDTHLFLGSTSAKTLEYFSRALGEKTIKISQKSKDGEEEQGKDQKLGRYLMTPDEIRRLPYDECLIYASGVKPIKAKKYFYFNHKDSMVPDKYLADNTSYSVDRGYWNAFSISKYQNEAKKRNINQMIQGNLGQNNKMEFVNLNDNKKENESLKFKNPNSNNNISNAINNSGNNNNSNKFINKNLNNSNNIDTSKKLNFNLDLNSDEKKEETEYKKQESNSTLLDKNNRTNIDRKNNLPPDHIDNLFMKKAEENLEEEKETLNFLKNSEIDNNLKENLNKNIENNNYSDRKLEQEIIFSEGIQDDEEDAKNEIKRHKTISGLKDINKEHLMKKLDKEKEEKEIEKKLEEKFQRLFGDISKDK